MPPKPLFLEENELVVSDQALFSSLLYRFGCPPFHWLVATRYLFRMSISCIPVFQTSRKKTTILEVCGSFFSYFFLSIFCIWGHTKLWKNVFLFLDIDLVYAISWILSGAE